MLFRSPEPVETEPKLVRLFRLLFYSTLLLADDALPKSHSPLFEDLRKRLRRVAGDVPALSGDGVRLS